MRKRVIRLSLLVVVAALLVFSILYVIAASHNGHSASASPSTSTSTNVPDVRGVADVSIDAIPISGGHPWRINSNSNQELAQCLTRERINFTGVHTRDYVNGVLGARASVSWISGVIAPPEYFTSAIQLCLTGVVRTSDATGANAGDFFDASATMVTNGRIRSYATAARANQMGTTGIPGTMILAFWTQPDAQLISPSPASVMAARAIALYKLAALGVNEPDVVTCPTVAERPITKVPPAVLTIIKAKYAKLAPVKILYQYTAVVDVRAESVTPHICLYSDGRQVAYSGKVPTSATQALVVDVQHAPSPPTESVENFLMLAKIPTQGWIIVDEWG